MDKKKLLALLIFLIMGFFMATFANPSEQLRPINENKDAVIENDNEANSTNSTKTTAMKNTRRNTNNSNATGDNKTTTTDNDNIENDGQGNVEPNQYLVRFMDNYDNIVKAQTVYEGEDATDSDITISDYTLSNITYTFSKWDKAFTNVVKDIDVKALYDVTKIVATVYVNNEETDKTIELIINNDTKNKKDVDLNEDNIEKYIKNIEDLPTPEKGKQDEVDKLIYDDEKGYIIVINEDYIDYTVTAYDGAYVNSKKSIKANINDVISLSHEEKKGYTFKYYIISNDMMSYNVYDDSVTLEDSDLEVYAVYELNIYTIDYELDSGKLSEGNINPSEYTVNTATFTLYNPSKVGFTFIGWAEGESINTNKNVTIVKGTTGNKKYTAVFKANNNTKYVVNTYLEKKYYESDDDKYDKISDTRRGTTGSNIDVTATDIRGFEVIGDKTINTTIAADGSTVVDFYYNRREYTVTFKMHDSELTKTTKYEGSVDSPKDVASYEENNATYVFEKFDKEATNVKDNMIINALYDIENISAIVELDDEEIGSAIIKVNSDTKNAFKNNATDEFAINNIDSISYEKDDDYDYEVSKLEYVKNQGFKVIVTRTLKKFTVETKDNVYVNGKNKVTDFIGTEVTLTHDDIDGKEFKNYIVDYESTSKVLNSDKYIIEKENVTIRAVYEDITYKVTFKYHGGEVVKETTYGNSVTAPTNLVSYVENGYSYVFNGEWDKSFNNITQDIIVNAIYTKSTIDYNIIYQLNGGKLKNANPTSYNVETETFTLNNPTKEGYTFVGWNEKGNTTVTIEKGTTGKKEFTALFEAREDIKYIIEVYEEKTTANEYKKVKTIEKQDGIADKKIEIEAPSASEGFELVGEATKNETINADGTTVVKFYYNRKTYKAIFTINDSKIEEKEFRYGTKIIAPDYTPKEGYNFSGWRVDDTMPANDTTYDATETIKTFTVKWVVDNKVVETDNNVEYGSTPSYDGTKPTKTYTDDVDYTYNYTFIGWKGLTSNTKITSNTTFEAELITLKATIDDNKQLSYSRNSSTSIKDDITVQVVNADGTVKKTLNDNEYTTDFNNSEEVKHKVLNITYKYSDDITLENSKLRYEVLMKAYNSKFEVKLSVNNSYYKTKFKNCTKNCDVAPNVESVTLDHNFLEVIEHYNQYVTVQSVTVTYKNGNSVVLDLSDDVRWTEEITYDGQTGLLNPTYLAQKTGYNLKDTYVVERKHISWDEDYPSNALEYNRRNGYYNKISGKCSSWFGCDYYEYSANTSATKNIYKFDSNNHLVSYTPSGYVDVLDDDNQIYTVTVKYHRNANLKDNESEGTFNVIFEYYKGEFVCIDEKEVK